MRHYTTNPDNWDSNHPFAPWNLPDQDQEVEDRPCEICDAPLATDEKTICADCAEVCAADDRHHAEEDAAKKLIH